MKLMLLLQLFAWLIAGIIKAVPNSPLSWTALLLTVIIILLAPATLIGLSYQADWIRQEIKIRKLRKHHRQPIYS